MKRDRRRLAEADAAAAGSSPSRRADRVASEIQRVVGQILVQDIRDQRAAQANITRVKVTPDLRHARIYFALLAKEQRDPAESVEALTRAAPYLRRRLAHDLGLRFTPDLEFFYDEQLDDARRIDSLLRSLHDQPSDDPADQPADDEC